jgi:outer membrane protein
MRNILLLLVALPLCAQNTLTLKEAVGIALSRNPAVAGAEASAMAAGTRVTQARGGALPKVNYAESFQRGDNPTYVFSSLLTQHQFGVENFNIGPLNRPNALNNFQSQVSVDQTIYDAGQTKSAVKSAELARGMSAEEQKRAKLAVTSDAARAYYGAVLAKEQLAVAEQSLKSAEADLKRAEAVRQAGMSTDVDVLSIRVHLAAVNEQRISRAADLDVAKATLNNILGLPLDAAHDLTTKLEPLKVREYELADLESGATKNRPEILQTGFARSLAQTQARAASNSMLPQVGFRAVFEADRQRFINRGGANWMAGVTLRWNVFNGGSDKAKIAEAGYLVRRAELDEQRVDSAVRLQVRQAYAALKAAGQRIEVARAAQAEADESLRITQNRYESGMANVTDLLRNETAVLESHARYLMAVHDQRVAATMVESAAGRLTADSEVLN